MLGIGTDILKISHLSAVSNNLSDPFIRKVYTSAEIEEAMRRDTPLHYFATRFAGKEAVFKALNLSNDGISLREIEILNDPTGRPTVVLSGNIEKLAFGQGIGSVLISLSFDTEYAIAFASAL